VAADTNVYPRPKVNQSERDKYVADLIDQLRDLERKQTQKMVRNQPKERTSGHGTHLRSPAISSTRWPAGR
jgi:hypothetical protein